MVWCVCCVCVCVWQVGEKVDARDCSMGAWFEAQVVKVMEKSPTHQSDSPSSSLRECEFYYHVVFDE